MTCMPEKRVICPRCGNLMVYMIEIEGGNSKRLKYYYKCPVCGYKLDDLVLSVRRGDEGLEIESLEVKKRLTYPPLNVVKR